MGQKLGLCFHVNPLLQKPTSFFESHDVPEQVYSLPSVAECLPVRRGDRAPPVLKDSRVGSLTGYGVEWNRRRCTAPQLL